MPDQKSIDFVLRTVEERDIRFIRLWFTDVLGNLKSFAISPEDLYEAFDEGIGFDGSAVEGFAPLEQSDMLAFPDPETFQILPWGGSGHDARMICSIKTPNGDPFIGDPRECLDRMFEKAEKMGYLFMVGPEFEYFYLKSNENPVLMDNAGYFDYTPFDSARNLRKNTTQTLERMSIPVAYSYHAVSPSQNGIQLRFAEAITCADNCITARHVIKREAFLEGMYASFMPKPFSDKPGSAFFMHQSLFDRDGNNLFWGGEDKEEGLQLSELAEHYIAGLLTYACELSLVTNPTVNSYKRLNQTGQVPTYATWGRKNRSAYVRIPTYKPGKVSSTRIELRMPDPTCNPYLAFATTLAAGLQGIQDGLILPPETTCALPTCTDGHFDPDAKKLPSDLGEAIEYFEASSLMKDVLGEHIFNYLLKVKKQEWYEYNCYVTQWEQEHYYAGF